MSSSLTYPVTIPLSAVERTAIALLTFRDEFPTAVYNALVDLGPTATLGTRLYGLTERNARPLAYFCETVDERGDARFCGASPALKEKLSALAYDSGRSLVAAPTARATTKNTATLTIQVAERTLALALELLANSVDAAHVESVAAAAAIDGTWVTK